MFRKLNKEEKISNLNKIRKNCSFYAEIYKEMDSTLSTLEVLNYRVEDE